MTTAQPGQEQRMVTDGMLKSGAEALWCRLDLNGHTLDGVKRAAADCYTAMHAARPTADLGDDGELDLPPLLYLEADQLNNPALARIIRQAADRIELLRGALAHCKRYAFRVAGNPDGHPFDRDNAQAVVEIVNSAALSRSGKGDG